MVLAVLLLSQIHVWEMEHHGQRKEFPAALSQQMDRAVANHVHLPVWLVLRRVWLEIKRAPGDDRLFAWDQRGVCCCCWNVLFASGGCVGNGMYPLYRSPKKVLYNPSVADVPRCEYHRLCRVLIQDQMPDSISLFDFRHDKCFCQRCFPSPDESYVKGGQRSSYPKGFCRLGLAMLEGELEQRKTWCNSYHGTKARASQCAPFLIFSCLQLDRVKSVIQGHGVLLFAGQVRFGGEQVGAASTGQHEVNLQVLRTTVR